MLCGSGQIHLAAQSFSNVFSLGDSSSAPASKTGAAIRKQAPVVVENLLAVMEKTPTERYEAIVRFYTYTIRKINAG
jgi:NADH dehydrogenase FAD-containing subunit